ncbi:MAG: DMT family transporter [Desulfobacteraceae bacterium]|nr:DMT family transporter [Desulfobacteraceae bacterium]
MLKSALPENVPEIPPVWVAVSGAALISFSGVWVKFAHVGPSASAFYRVMVGSVLLLALSRLYGRRLWNGHRYAGWTLLCGAAFALDLWAYHKSILFVGPGLSTILGNFQVFVLGFAGVVFFGERLDLRLVLAVPLAMAGLYLVVGIDWGQLPEDYRWGVYFGLATAVFYASFTLSLRRMQSAADALAPSANLGSVCLIAALFLAADMTFTGESFRIPDLQSLFSLAALGVLSQVAGWLLITRALPALPASSVGLLLLLQPSLAFVWDVLIFRRPTGWTHAVGIGLTLAAIYLGLARKPT